jgi:hypothetical protein
MAVLRAASVDIECCFFDAVGLGPVDLTGFEYGRAARCWRSGDFSGTGGGGIDGGGDEGPSDGDLLARGGLGSGGGFGLLALDPDTGIIGKAPGTGGGDWNGGGVAGLVLALRNELAPMESGVRARGNESDIEDDSGGLRNISPEGRAGRFGGAVLPFRSVGEGANGLIALPPSCTDSAKLPASLPVVLRLGGLGGAGRGGNSVAGKLVPLPPSPTDADLPFLLNFFLIFHSSLSVSRISSTSLLMLAKKREAFFFSCLGISVFDSTFWSSLAPLMLVPPVLLARLACNCARRACISARERVAVGGGANMAVVDMSQPEVSHCSPVQGMSLTDRISSQ